MKKILILLSIVTCVVWIYACKHVTSASFNNYYCGVGSADTICPYLPVEVIEPILHNEGYTTDFMNFTDSATSADSLKQTPLDLFSWQTFLALNWPSDVQGKPKGSIYNDNLSALRVWEHYRDPLEVFGYVNHPLFLHLNAAKQDNNKFLYMTSKSPRNLLEKLPIGSFDEADGLPLVDRNMNFTLFEIKLNHVEDTFITNNNLISVDGIYKYTQTGFQLPASDTLTNAPGMMEIKAAWRILTASDDPALFYCRNAVIYVDSLHTFNHKALLIPNVKVGLVGMHIIRHTTLTGSNLIWSSFEHVNNDPDSLAVVDTSIRWSYYNPACTACTVNTAPPHVAGDDGRYIWQLTQPYAGFYSAAMNGSGTQVKRVNKIFKYTDSVNQKFRTKMAGTVWANYKLIGSQWMIGGEGPKTTAAPPLMANTVQETYIQASASCIGCHSFASVTFTPSDTSKKPINISTGMSFIFNASAHPQKK